jgi:hypothetical protein
MKPKFSDLTGEQRDNLSLADFLEYCPPGEPLHLHFGTAGDQGSCRITAGVLKQTVAHYDRLQLHEQTGGVDEFKKFVAEDEDA